MARMNPLQTVNEMRRNLERYGSDEENIGFDKLRNMKWVVRNARDESCKDYLGGIAQTDKIADLRKLCHSKSLAKAINQHNEDHKNKLLEYHGVVCLSEKMKGADEDLHATFTTPYLLLNATRSLNCPFEVWTEHTGFARWISAHVL